MAGEIHFFPDAHPDSGLGHLVRCTSLAHALKYRYTPIFWVSHPDWARQVVPFEVRDRDHYRNESAVWSVVDSYQDQPEWWNKVRGQSQWMLLVDDGLQPFRNVDLILNPAAGGSVWKAYAGLGIPVLNGPAYALLRPAFLEPHNPWEGRQPTVVVCFGGRDPRNLTQQVAKELSSLPYLGSIHAVLGPAADEWQVSDERIQVVRNLDAEAMADLMASAAYAVVPASGLAYEALASGCRVVTGWYINNQQGLFQGLVEEGHVLSADGFEPGKVKAAFERGFQESWPQPPSRPWDGLSPFRISAAVYSVEQAMEVRTAEWSHRDLLLAWANDPATRQASFHPQAIEPQQHEAWFRKRINHPDYHILIGYVGAHPVGSFRVERHAEGWVCSLVIAPEARGQGWATTLIFKACHNLREQHSLAGIIAYIKADNAASIKVFTRAGFTFVRETIQGNTPSFEYRWS